MNQKNYLAESVMVGLSALLLAVVLFVAMQGCGGHDVRPSGRGTIEPMERGQ